jgi:hypothetical protein
MMRWLEHREIRNAYKMLVGKSQGKSKQAVVKMVIDL